MRTTDSTYRYTKKRHWHKNCPNKGYSAQKNCLQKEYSAQKNCPPKSLFCSKQLPPPPPQKNILLKRIAPQKEYSAQKNCPQKRIFCSKECSRTCKGQHTTLTFGAHFLSCRHLFGPSPLSQNLQQATFPSGLGKHHQVTVVEDYMYTNSV